jgi:hypothetical protein
MWAFLQQIKNLWNSKILLDYSTIQRRLFKGSCNLYSLVLAFPSWGLVGDNPSLSYSWLSTSEVWFFHFCFELLMDKKFPQFFQHEKGLFCHDPIIQKMFCRMCICACVVILYMFQVINVWKVLCIHTTFKIVLLFNSKLMLLHLYFYIKAHFIFMYLQAYMFFFKKSMWISIYLHISHLNFMSYTMSCIRKKAY